MSVYLSKFHRVFAATGLILFLVLLLPVPSNAMGDMNSSNCTQKVMCNICIFAISPEVQASESELPPSGNIETAPQSINTLPIKPACPPPKS